MGRTSDARERLIDAARELIHSRGYEAVGVSEICANAGVNKGSFYHFFKSKQTLGVAVIDEHWTEARQAWAEILEGSGDPIRRLDHLMKSLTRKHHAAKDSFGHTIGCLLGNMTLERSNQDPEIQSRLREIFSEQRSLVSSVLEEAAEDGLLAKGVTPKNGARTVVAFIQGLVLMAKLYDDPNMLRGASANLHRMIAA